MTTETRTDYQEYAVDHFRRTAKAIAEMLRDTADRIEREATSEIRDSVTVPGSPYAASAQRIVHQFVWGTANAGVDRIVTAAAEADTATRETR